MAKRIALVALACWQLLAFAGTGTDAAAGSPQSTGLPVEPLRTPGSKGEGTYEQAQKSVSVDDQLKLAERKIKELSQRAEAASQAARLEQDRATKAESARKSTSRETDQTLYDNNQEKMKMRMQFKEAENKLASEREISRTLSHDLTDLTKVREALEAEHSAMKLQLQNVKATHSRLLDERNKEVEYRVQLEKDVASLQAKIGEHHDDFRQKFDDQAALYAKNLETVGAGSCPPPPPPPPCSCDDLSPAAATLDPDAWVVVRFPALEGLLGGAIDYSWRYGYMKAARVWWAGEGSVPAPPPGREADSLGAVAVRAYQGAWKSVLGGGAERAVDRWAAAAGAQYKGVRSWVAAQCPGVLGADACASAGAAWGHVEGAFVAMAKPLRLALLQVEPTTEAALVAVQRALLHAASAVPGLGALANPGNTRAAACLALATVAAYSCVLAWSLLCALGRWLLPAGGLPSPRTPTGPNGGGFPKSPRGDGSGGGRGSPKGKGGAGSPKGSSSGQGSTTGGAKSPKRGGGDSASSGGKGPASPGGGRQRAATGAGAGGGAALAGKAVPLATLSSKAGAVGGTARSAGGAAAAAAAAAAVAPAGGGSSAEPERRPASGSVPAPAPARNAAPITCGAMAAAGPWAGPQLGASAMMAAAC